ncbi:hypothetical protein BC834DRAFT_386420 [Gloeopeniophorella convolvens]|nr:hypothetical protein BC834DRAFT_386420 [Gloeopeniophorella convolvens]
MRPIFSYNITNCPVGVCTVQTPDNEKRIRDDNCDDLLMNASEIRTITNQLHGCACDASSCVCVSFCDCIRVSTCSIAGLYENAESARCLEKDSTPCGRYSEEAGDLPRLPLTVSSQASAKHANAAIARKTITSTVLRSCCMVDRAVALKEELSFSLKSTLLS